MRKEAVKMPYPGSVISVNHYLGRRRGGGYYVKPECVAWKEHFGWLLKRLSLTEWSLPLYVTCSAVFKNERSACDLSNLSKVINDSIAEVSGFNDKDFRWSDGDRVIDNKQEPYLLITISEGKPVSPAIAPKLKSRRVKVSGHTKPSNKDILDASAIKEIISKPTKKVRRKK